MTDSSERSQHRLLSLIENAQRAGHSEPEIVAIVDGYLGEPPPPAAEDVGRDRKAA